MGPVKTCAAHFLGLRRWLIFPRFSSSIPVSGPIASRNPLRLRARLRVRVRSNIYHLETFPDFLRPPHPCMRQ